MSDVDTDALARERSLDPDRSVLLQAPAGSGKTTVLIQRYLRLLGVVQSPEQILAITFTRKAAGEMMHRVQEALASAPVDPLTAELAAAARQRSLELGWQIGAHPSRLRIQTIDALNHRLAAALPIAARAGASLQLADDPEELYRRAAGLALRSAEADPVLQHFSGLWFERLGNDWARLQALLAQMLARRGHWLRHLAGESTDALATSVSASLESLVRSQLETAARVLPAAILHEAVALLREARSWVVESGRPMPSPHWEMAAALVDEPRAAGSHLAVWRALTTLALTADTSSARPLRKTVDARMGFAPKSTLKQRAIDWLGKLAERNEFVDVLVATRALPDPEFCAEDRAALAALSALLQHAVAELALVFAHAGGVDHTAISGAARQALTHSNGSELAIHQGDQLRHILVDEFQDTSVEQFELIAGLIDQWQAGEPRSLFLVGDPMQSIYQFREAEVALFMRARDEGIAGWPLEFLSLTRNFRSQPAIVQFVNECFSQVFPPFDDRRTGAVRYHPSEAATAKPAALPSAVHCWQVPSADGEAERVLEIVKEARAANATASIAVLVAARPHSVAIARTLRRHGIATRGVDLVPIMEMPVVQDLLALTRALLSPADRIAWLAVLRAPWCGLELESLANWLLHAGPGISIAEALLRDDGDAALPEASARRVTQLRDVLFDGLARLQHAPLALVVESIWLRLGGPACYASSTVISDAEQFFIALRAQHDRKPVSGVADLERVLGGLYAASEGNASDAVQIMSIHRAKGLEFDCVILPGLGRGAPPDGDPLLQWLEWVQADGKVDLLLSPIRPAGQEADALSRWMREVTAQRRRHERARVLYVAATRARSALHMLGTLPEPKRDELIVAPRSGTPLGTLWPAVAARFLAAGPPASVTRGPQDAAIGPGGAEQWLERLPADWQCPAPENAFEMQGIRMTSVEATDAPEFRWAGELARQVGVVVHRELQFLSSAESTREEREDTTRRRRVHAWLEAEGVAAIDAQDAISRVLRAIDGTLRDARGQWLLDRRHRDSSSELALTGLYEGRLENVVIDRSFVDAEGRRWVIDYKTSEHLGGDRPGFIANELRRYRGQLEKYRALAAGLGPEPVHAALYFPMFGSFVEID